MSEVIPPSKKQMADAARAVEALRPILEDRSQLTFDEGRALDIVAEALRAIAAGDDLSQPPEGSQKLRLIRRIECRYYLPTAPRPQIVVHEDVADSGEQRG